MSHEADRGSTPRAVHEKWQRPSTAGTDSRLGPLASPSRPADRHWTPNSIPAAIRIGTALIALALLAWGSAGVIYQHLLLPISRSGALVPTGIAAVLMGLSAWIAAVACVALIVDHYDRRRNEDAYSVIYVLCGRAAAILFLAGLALYVLLALFMPSINVADSRQATDGTVMRALVAGAATIADSIGVGFIGVLFLITFISGSLGSAALRFGFKQESHGLFAVMSFALGLGTLLTAISGLGSEGRYGSNAHPIWLSVFALGLVTLAAAPLNGWLMFQKPAHRPARVSPAADAAIDLEIASSLRSAPTETTAEALDSEGWPVQRLAYKTGNRGPWLWRGVAAVLVAMISLLLAIAAALTAGDIARTGKTTLRGIGYTKPLPAGRQETRAVPPLDYSRLTRSRFASDTRIGQPRAAVVLAALIVGSVAGAWLAYAAFMRRAWAAAFCLLLAALVLRIAAPTGDATPIALTCALLIPAAIMLHALHRRSSDFMVLAAAVVSGLSILSALVAR